MLSLTYGLSSIFKTLVTVFHYTDLLADNPLRKCLVILAPIELIGDTGKRQHY